VLQPKFADKLPPLVRAVLPAVAARLGPEKWAAQVARMDAAFDAAEAGDVGPALEMARSLGVPEAKIQAVLAQCPK
jgi:hypothetical protein